jgi:hypothetical protein
MLRPFAALVLIATPAAAFDGIYGNCLGTGENAPLRISGDVIVLPDAECRMTNPVLVRDMPGAVLFDFVCTGEGAAWTERAFVQWAEDGGLILVRRRIARTLPRCP